MPRAQVSIDKLPISSAGAVALFLITAAGWESKPPRLWSTSRREVADACRVSTAAVGKWINGTSKPSETMQAVLESRFLIPHSWWSHVAPASDSEELLPMAWLLGIAKPDAEQRAAIEAAFGVAVDTWDQPTA